MPINDSHIPSAQAHMNTHVGRHKRMGVVLDTRMGSIQQDEDVLWKKAVLT